MAAAMATLSERKPSLIGILTLASAAPPHLVRHADGLAPEQQDV